MTELIIDELKRKHFDLTSILVIKIENNILDVGSLFAFICATILSINYFNLAFRMRCIHLQNYVLIRGVIQLLKGTAVGSYSLTCLRWAVQVRKSGIRSSFKHLILFSLPIFQTFHSFLHLLKQLYFQLVLKRIQLHLGRVGYTSSY